jgi:hypothetical protein
MIEKVKELLKENGFTNEDYIISLQGPTLIPTKSGNIKLNNDLDLKIDLIGLIKII